MTSEVVAAVSRGMINTFVVVIVALVVNGLLKFLSFGSGIHLPSVIFATVVLGSLQEIPALVNNVLFRQQVLRH